METLYIWVEDTGLGGVEGRERFIKIGSRDYEGSERSPSSCSLQARDLGKPVV